MCVCAYKERELEHGKIRERERNGWLIGLLHADNCTPLNTCSGVTAAAAAVIHLSLILPGALNDYLDGGKKRQKERTMSTRPFDPKAEFILLISIFHALI